MRAAFPLALAVFAAVPAMAQTKFPGLTYAHPVAVQRGATAVVALGSNGDLTTAHQVLVSGAGVVGKVLAPVAKQPAGECRVELTVAPDAPVGPREIRVATKPALSTLAMVYVTPHAVAPESPKNDAPEQAQELRIPGVVAGRAEKNVDLDWYRFRGKAGERVTFAVVGARLHNTVHKIGRFVGGFDAMLTVTDEAGAELAVNDDHYFADPLLSFLPPRDGAYRLCLREATYKGNEMYTYALVALPGAQPTLTLPFAAAPGESAIVHLLGQAFPRPALGRISVPADAARGSVRWLNPTADGGPLAEVPVLVDDVPRVAQRTPAGVAAAPPPTATPVGGKKGMVPKAAPAPPPPAQAVAVPSGVFGAIDRPGAVHRFRFDATKDQWYRMEVFARRLYAPVDSELRLTDLKGNVLATNDDYRSFVGRLSRDSLVEWKAPRTEPVVLHLRDMLGRGGPQHAYHLRIAKGEPDFELSCDPSLCMVGPGSRTPVYVKAVRRHGFDGPIRLSVAGLPPGMTAATATIPAKLDYGCVVLSVAADAKPAAANVRVTGSAEVVRAGKPTTLTVPAVPLAEIYQAQRWAVETIGVAVTQPSDIRVETPVKRVALRPGESMEIPITVHRAEKYKKGPVTLWGDWRFENRLFGSTLPAGVKVDMPKSRTALNGTATEGKVTLTAAADAAPTGPIQTVVVGQVSIEFSVAVPYCTAPIELTVLPAAGRRPKPGG